MKTTPKEIARAFEYHSLVLRVALSDDETRDALELLACDLGHYASEYGIEDITEYVRQAYKSHQQTISDLQFEREEFWNALELSRQVGRGPW